METKEEFAVFEQDWRECEHCDRSYYEHDTGYAEYECNLYDTCECTGGSIDLGCPLSFRYKVEGKEYD